MEDIDALVYQLLVALLYLGIDLLDAQTCHLQILLIGLLQHLL